MSTQWETVGIPFGDGIKPSTRARLLEATKLQVAQNCQYAFDQGPEKRHGHGTKKVFGFGTLIGDPALTPPTREQTIRPRILASLATGSTDAGLMTEPGIAALPHYLRPQRPGCSLGRPRAMTRSCNGTAFASLSTQLTSARPRSTRSCLSFEALRSPRLTTPRFKQTWQRMPLCARSFGFSDKGVGYRSTYDTISGACIVDSEAISDTTNIRVLCVGSGRIFWQRRQTPIPPRCFLFTRTRRPPSRLRLLRPQRTTGSLTSKKSSESLFFTPAPTPILPSRYFRQTVRKLPFG